MWLNACVVVSRRNMLVMYDSIAGVGAHGMPMMGVNIVGLGVCVCRTCKMRWRLWRGQIVGPFGPSPVSSVPCVAGGMLPNIM